MERIEESIESLISSIIDTALERAIQSGGSVEIEMAETEHPQVACDVFEAETDMISLAEEQACCMTWDAST